MKSLFSPDSKFMQGMTRIADLILLNIFFLVTCIPVVTIGASFTALYDQLFRITSDTESGIFLGFFRAFRDNFKQATVLWLILLFAGGCMIANIYLFYTMTNMLRYIFVVFVLMLIIVLLTFAMIFPLLSQFESSSHDTLKNALMLGIAYAPRALPIAAMFAFPPILLLKNVILFFNTAFIWVTIYFSAAAYFSTLLLKKVFAPYLNDEDNTEEDEI